MHVLKTSVLALAAVSLTACGQSQFVQDLTPICEERGGLPGYSGDCACVIEQLDQGLTDQQKAALIPLRWELMHDPADRDRLNREALRAAGIDPEDGQAVRSARSELQDRLAVLDEEIAEQCPAAT